jgi:hypothetical protein
MAVWLSTDGVILSTPEVIDLIEEEWGPILRRLR